MSRNASCIDTTAGGKEVNASECGTDSRPKTDMKCQLAPCSAQWMASDWSQVRVIDSYICVYHHSPGHGT